MLKAMGVVVLLAMGAVYGWAASFVLNVWWTEPLRLTPVDARVIFGGMILVFSGSCVTCLMLAWQGLNQLVKVQ